MNKKLSFANLFSVGLVVLIFSIFGCSNEPKPDVKPTETVMTNQDQLKALKLANQKLYNNPRLAKDVARDSENWDLDGESLALRQWLHTQQQSNRGDYDQAWRMINEINLSNLPKKSQMAASSLYWQLATILNICPQWQGTHEQQFNFLAVTENPQCQKNLDSHLKELVSLIKDPTQPSWAKNLSLWHEQNPQHWANDFVKWHKIKNAQHDAKRIAVILPLTGEYAQVSKEIQDGMLALHPFLSQATLSFHDTNQYGPQKAYEEALKTSPTMVIGPLTSQELQTITINGSIPMISFGSANNANQNMIHMVHDPYQIQKLLSLSKAMGHEHMVWLTDPVFNKMQSFWPNSVARYGQIPIKSESLKTLLMIDDKDNKTTNTNLKYDGLILLGNDTYELQTVAHEYMLEPVQTFITGPDGQSQKHFYEHTVMLKSPWLNQNNDNALEFSPFQSVLSKLNANNQTWYNAIGIDALLLAYYGDEINAIKTPMTMATGKRQIIKNQYIVNLNAYHIQDNTWHPLLALNNG